MEVQPITAPQRGIPRTFKAGEWVLKPRVTVTRDPQSGQITEIRQEDGIDPITTIRPLTPADEDAEQAVLDATSLYQWNV